MNHNFQIKQKAAVSDIRPAHLFGEGCVLQRGERTRIWGWQEGGRRLAVSFQGKSYETQVRPDGSFELFISCAQPGGPFCLEFFGENGTEKTVNEVYVGDVFVCAGQSNMELPMERVKERFPEEFFCADDLKTAQKDAGLSVAEPWMKAYELFTGIPRQMRGSTQVHVYKVPECASFSCEKEDHDKAGWVTCSGNALADVSAFSYFFGRFLNQEKKVPIGIINISLGGTPIQAWMSEEGLAAWPQLVQIKKQLEDDTYLQSVSKKQEEETAAWEKEALNKEEKSVQTAWDNIQIPGYFAQQGLEGYCGVLWLKRTFRAEKEDAGQEALLRFGTLTGTDRTYLNGVCAGETDSTYTPRRYEIPKGLIKEGENEICIRLVCTSPQGRVTPDKPYELVTASGKRIDLKGTWQYQAKGICRPAPEWDPVFRRPSGLFQGMTAPCLKASVKGIIWYQGEANDCSPEEYEALLKAMIQDWRSRWGQERLPFILIQLPVCGVDTAGGGAWALIRKAQQQAEQLADVAVTVNLDLGEYYDLHPLNKKDVAYRAFLAAQHLIYGEDVIWQGPQPAGFEKQKDSLFLRFDTKDGKELCVWNGLQPQEFEAAGEDGEFVPVPAKAEKDGVRLFLDKTGIQSADRVRMVRYAWSDTPLRGLLCNQAGLFTGPFVMEIS